MTATHPTDRSLAVTTQYSPRRASTHPAEANHQVGTLLSSRHRAPAPTLSPCVLQPPSKPPASPPRHRTPPPARPPSRLSSSLLFLSLLLLRLTSLLCLCHPSTAAQSIPSLQQHFSCANPPIHGGSSVDTRSIAESPARSAPAVLRCVFSCDRARRHCRLCLIAIATFVAWFDSALPDPAASRRWRHWRAVGGDVVGHELPEQPPHRCDLSVDTIGVDAQIARAAGPSERVQTPSGRPPAPGDRGTKRGSAHGRSGAQRAQAQGSGRWRCARRARSRRRLSTRRAVARPRPGSAPG